jgi:C-terminal processing protease CtpA/Prc
MNSKNSRIFLIAVIFLVVLGFQSIASLESQQKSADPEKAFTIEQFQQDFRIFRNALEEGHAGLYRYTPKEEMDEHFATIQKQLDRPHTEYDFYRLLAPLIGHIHDGHTRISLSASLEDFLAWQPILFPFNLRFIGKKVYLFRNYSEKDEITMGSELLSIDGYPVSEIIQQMLPFVPHDARIETAKYRRLESTSNFGALLSLLNGRHPSFTITYKEFGSQDEKTITVASIKAAELNTIFASRYPEAQRERPPIQLEYKENIGILAVRTFSSDAFRSAKIGYPTFLKNAFQELEKRNTRHLIIDLRDNGGGDDAYGKILFQHLIDKPFQYYAHLRMNQSEFSFLEYTNVPQEQRNRFASRLKKNDEGTYDLLFHPNLGEQKPIPPVFKGKVYVLINGNSFSGTGECTSLMNHHQVATFIGEECGAGYYGNTSGFMPLLTLPNTQIRVRIPMLRYTMAVSGYPEDRGIIPDYPVSPTIEDLVNGKDTVMEFSLDLIRKNR